jgi:hypothetical protein
VVSSTAFSAPPPDLPTLALMDSKRSKFPSGLRAV